MPESVSGVNEILDGLREKAVFVSVTASRPMEVQFSPVDGPGGGFVEFADAVAAVHAAADARTAIAVLADAERAAAKARRASCVAATDQELARIVALIAASEASHAPALTRMLAT